MTHFIPSANFVIPAKAGIHHLTVRFGMMGSVMDSRLRGNDECGCEKAA